MKKFDLKNLQGSKRTLRSGSYATVLAVVVLAFVILVNLVVQALPSKWTEFDISTSSLFTLSDTSKNLLHELNSDVTAYYLAESGQEDTNITRLLDRYADESSHFGWQQRDPVLYPTFAQQYDGAATGSVVLSCGDNYRVVGYNDMYQLDIENYYTSGSQQYTFEAENALTSALAQVSRTTAYKLYQLTGHGELALDTDFTDTLTNAGCDHRGTEPDHGGQHPRRCRQPAAERAPGRPDRGRSHPVERLRNKRRQAAGRDRLYHRYPAPGCHFGKLRHDPPSGLAH